MCVTAQKWSIGHLLTVSPGNSMNRLQIFYFFFLTCKQKPKPITGHKKDYEAVENWSSLVVWAFCRTGTHRLVRPHKSMESVHMTRLLWGGAPFFLMLVKLYPHSNLLGKEVWVWINCSSYKKIACLSGFSERKANQEQLNTKHFITYACYLQYLHIARSLECFIHLLYKVN